MSTITVPDSLPWHRNDPREWNTYIHDAQGNSVAKCDPLLVDYIVHAANVYPALVEALTSLRNEASGFLSMADPDAHGQTNLNCLQRRIDQADAALTRARETETT